MRAAYSVTMSLGNLAMQVFGHQYHESQIQLRFPNSEQFALSQIWSVGAKQVKWPAPAGSIIQPSMP